MDEGVVKEMHVICSFDYGEALSEILVVSFMELQQFEVLSVTPPCCGHEPWVMGWFSGVHAIGCSFL